MPAETVCELSIEEKRAELSAILESKEFGRSPALARLLEYLCTKTFNGQDHEIKEFSIATEVFGRGEDFSEKRDSLVRVEVHRLRKKLQSYYEKEGASRPVRIVIRPGNYQPDFDRAPEAAAPAENHKPAELDPHRLPEPPADITGKREGGIAPGKRNLWIAAFAAAILIVAIVLAHRQQRIRAEGEDAPGAAAINAHQPLAANPSGVVRILAGSTAPESFDRFGEAWGPDRFYSGGSSNVLKFGDQQRSVRHPAIAGADDQTAFRTFRSGAFSYAIPLARANYEMRLYFSEVVFGSGDNGDGAENQRVFDVVMNGKTILPFHDIYSDAGGPDLADVHVFENVAPAADGRLHLDFRPLREGAWLNAIELIPNAAGKPRPVRIVAQNENYADSRGVLWQSDRYFVGGRNTSDGKTVSGVADPDLFSAVRYGHFSYRIPVAPGRYTLRLYFAETFFGPGNRGQGGIGSRLFNVYCAGAEILRNFDIFGEAGENREIVKTFRGITPNPAGRVDVTFEPVTNYAVLNALELEPEDASGGR